MKVFEIVSAKEVLEKLSQNKSLPTRTAYKVYLMLDKAQATLQFYETKRMEIFREFGVEKDGQIEIPPEKIPEASSKMDEVLGLDIEDTIEKVDISLDVDLGISPSEIQQLIPFINFTD
ncbi:MAG: hypothetical protein J6T96_05075 [Bacteroidales bacterium]|nr:hypothetical protein [Bacteroidales bacterium]